VNRLVEINSKVEESIVEVLIDFNQPESVRAQFIQMFKNLVTNNYERSDLIRLIENLVISEKEEK